MFQTPRFNAPALPSRPTAAGRSHATAVELKKVTSENAPLSEETVMHDLTPLFLPTSRNASLRRLPQREPGRTFWDNEALKLGLAETGWNYGKDLRPVATINHRPVSEAGPIDALIAITPAPALAGFGRSELAVAELRPRGAFVEVVAAGTGRRVIGIALPVEARPPTDKVWRPLEFMAAVEPAGLVAPLALTARSGVEEVDVYFQKYLARTFRVGERLLPGFYRITVAP